MLSKKAGNPANYGEADTAQLYLAEVINSSHDAIIVGTPDGTIDRWSPAAGRLFGYKAAQVKGKPISALMLRNSSGALRGILKQVRRAERVEDFEAVCIAKDGHRVDVSLTVSPIKDASGMVVGILVIARDLSRRQRGRAALERRNRELETFHELSDVLLSTRSLEETYCDIVDGIRVATGFPIAAIALYDESRQAIVFHGLRGEHRHLSRSSIELPIDETVSGIVIRSGKPLTEKHVLNQSKYRSKFLRGARAQTFVGYPMKIGMKIIGCLNLAHTESIEISPDMARWIESLANYAAVLTERKRSEDELQRSREQLRELSRHVQDVVEEERKRIAREIHDALGQELSLLQLELGLIQEQLPKSEKQLRKKTREMSKLVDVSIRSVQRISADLRPALLDNLGLGAAVEWLVKRFVKRARMSCEISIDPPQLKLDPERSTALFRILQEAMTNVLRHARATNVGVHLVKSDKLIIMTVRDNGIGIPPDRITDSKSVGLTGMRERVLPWGGRVDFIRLSTKGTEVVVTLPVRP